MAEYNLRSVHISCIYYLYSLKHLTATELCEHCEEDKATISRALVFLEKNDYLVCESVLTKRYNSPLTLTEKGKAVGKKIAERISEVLEEFREGLTEDERKVFYNSLSFISNKLESVARRNKE